MNRPTLRRAISALAFAAASLAPFASAKAAYVLTELTRPGAALVALWDVNNSGQMVGYSATGLGPTDFAQGFVYDGSTFTTLSGPAGAAGSFANGISDSGTVVGSYFTATGGVPDPALGFIYSGGSYTVFVVAGADATQLRGISPDGRYLSGHYDTATASIGFVYDTVTGILTSVSRPDSTFTLPQGINSSGVLVGGDILAGPPPNRPGFFYDIGTSTRTDVNIAGAQRTALRSIDDAGIISGWFMTGGVPHGFTGSIASFEQIDFAGADQTFVEGSNNARVLVGTYYIGDVSHAFIATPVPEPGALSLLALALGGLAWSRRTRPR